VNPPLPPGPPPPLPPEARPSRRASGQGGGGQAQSGRAHINNRLYQQNQAQQGLRGQPKRLQRGKRGGSGDAFTTRPKSSIPGQIG
jgi:hypothetical protein